MCNKKRFKKNRNLEMALHRGFVAENGNRIFFCLFKMVTIGHWLQIILGTIIIIIKRKYSRKMVYKNVYKYIIKNNKS